MVFPLHTALFTNRGRKHKTTKFLKQHGASVTERSRHPLPKSGWVGCIPHTERLSTLLVNKRTAATTVVMNTSSGLSR